MNQTALFYVVLVQTRLQCERQSLPGSNAKPLDRKVRGLNTRAAPTPQSLLVSPAIVRAVSAAAVEHSMLAVVSGVFWIEEDPQVFHHSYLCYFQNGFSSDDSQFP